MLKYVIYSTILNTFKKFFFNGYLLLLVSVKKSFNYIDIACSYHWIQTLVCYTRPSSVLKHLELLTLTLKLFWK